MKKYKVLKVTKIEHYLIPMANNTRTEINDWTIKEVIKDWFKKRPIPQFHAARDAHKICGEEYVKKVEIVDKISLDKETQLL